MKLKANEYHQQLSPCVMSYIALIGNTVFATMKKHYCLTNRKMNKNCQNKNTCLIYKQNHRQHGEKENETKNPQPPSAPLHPPPKKPITMCLNNTDILCISQFFFGHHHTTFFWEGIHFKEIVLFSPCFLMWKRICMTTGALLQSSHAYIAVQAWLSASASKPY